MLKIDLPDFKSRINAWRSARAKVSKIPGEIKVFFFFFLGSVYSKYTLIIKELSDFAFLFVFLCLGVSSVVRNEGEMTVIGTMDPQDILEKLNKYWPTEILKVEPWVESSKSRSKKHKHFSEEESLAAEISLAQEISREEAILAQAEEAFLADAMLMSSLAVTKSLSCEERSRSKSTEESGDPGSGTSGTNFQRKSTTIPLHPSCYQNDEWNSFCEFLSNRLRPLTLSGCRSNDVIDFLRIMRQASSDVHALVGRLSSACDVFGIKPKNNPFHSVAVTAYLETTRERETECILVVSCNGNFDVDETSFIEAILKELHKREVAPVSYNLLGRQHLDAEMLNRSSVGIMVLSNSYACSRQSLDHLVAVMEHLKVKNVVIVPVYFKVTLSDICGLEGKFEAVFLQYLSSAQPDRVQKWEAAMADLASTDGHEWTKE